MSAALQEADVQRVLGATLSGIDQDTSDYFCGMIMDNDGVDEVRMQVGVYVLPRRRHACVSACECLMYAVLTLLPPPIWATQEALQESLAPFFESYGLADTEEAARDLCSTLCAALRNLGMQGVTAPEEVKQVRRPTVRMCMYESMYVCVRV